MNPRSDAASASVVLTLVLAAFTGCASSGETPPRDPFESFNRPVYSFNEGADEKILEPVARGYARVVPDPAERAIARFFTNLDAADRMAGALLQGEVREAGVEIGRFVINSTVGFLGLFDPAAELDLHNTEEDIGQALASWGLDETPYLILPLMGPMTLAQIPDRVLTGFLPPWLLGDYWHPLARGLNIVSSRAEALGATAIVDESAVDPYSFVRESYLQRRRYLLYDGNPPLEDMGGFLDDAESSPEP